MSDAPAPVPLDALLRHRGFVRELARRLVADENAADDVEQETWLEALRRPPRNDRSPRGWLATVTRNAARKFGRGAARRTKHETATAARDPHRDVADLAAEAEIGRRLVGFVLELPEPYRGTVLLRWFDGLGAPAIAHRTGVPLETVRTRLKRALAMLRERMDARHDGNRAAWALVLGGHGVSSARAARWGKEIAMAVSKKAAVLAAALVLVAGAVWGTWPSRNSDVATEPEIAGSTAVAAHAKVRVSAPMAATVGATPPAATSVDPLLQADPRSAHRVIVKTFEGDPVPGATIELHLQRERNPTIGPEIRSRFGAAVAADGCFTTGADGVALLPQLPPSVSGTMIVRRAGFAIARALASASEIVLLPGCELTGRVVDSRGRPVAGAPVCVGTVRANPWSGPDPSVTISRTDAAGRFALRDLPSGTVAVFAGWPDGTPTKSLEVVLPGARAVDVVLPGGGAIAGRVTESGTGAPVEGALVSIQQYGSGMPLGPAFATASTGADGAYRIEHFAADSWDDVRVSKAGWYQSLRGSTMSHNHLERDGVAPLDLTLSRGGRVAGHVLGPDGPVPGATISLVGPDAGGEITRARTKSGSDGGYSFEGLPPGRVAFAVQGSDFVQEGWSGSWIDEFRAGSVPPDAAADVRAGEEVTHDLHLVRAVAVAGRVLSPDGSPVSGATVQVQYTGASDGDDPRGWNSASIARTDAAGRFALKGIVPDSKIAISAWLGELTATQAVGIARAEVGEVTLRLAPYGETHVVHVHVIWPDGAAPRGAVWFVGDWSGWEARSGNRDNAFLDAAPQLVPANGRFDVSVASWGDAGLVRVSAPGFAPTDSPPLRIKDTRETSLEMRPLPVGVARLAGTIVAKDGRAVAGAQVRLRFVDPAARPAKDEWYQGAPRPVIGPVAASSDARGAFEATGLSTGAYQVQIVASGFEWWSGKAESPSVALRVELVPLGVLTGRVHFADGAPAVGVRVSTERQEVYRAETVTDGDGRFRFDDVPSGGVGVYVCSAFDGTGANIRHAQITGWKRAGEDLDVVVEPGLSIAGKVVGTDGLPVPGTGIVRATAEDRNEHGVSLRPDGTFEIRGLAPGRNRVSFEHNVVPGVTRLRVDAVDGVESGTKGLTLVARSGLSIEGDVEMPADAASSAQRVLVRRPEVRGLDTLRGTGRDGTLDPHGHFRIDGLDAGRWRIVFQDRQGLDSPWQAGDAALVEAGAADVRLTLSTSFTISGTVTFDGTPQQNCNVIARSQGDDKDACSVTSWSEGKFTFVGLDPAKHWNLTAYRENLVQARAAGVAVGTTGIALQFTVGLSIRGSLLRADGTRAANLIVSFRRDDDTSGGWSRSDDEGVFEARGIEPGEYVAKVYLAATKEGEPGGYVDVGRVRAGETNVELRLPR